MTETLRPCPFCGGDAKHNEGGNSVYGRLWWEVGCTDCDVIFSDREVWDKDNPGMLDPTYPPKECFDRWNRRDDVAGEALSALKEGRRALGVAVEHAGGDPDTHLVCRLMALTIAKLEAS